MFEILNTGMRRVIFFSILTVSLVALDVTSFLVNLGYSASFSLGLVSLALVTTLIPLAVLVYGQTPKAQVDRLLYSVLKAASEREAQSVTFVLNDVDRSLYIDIDNWVVVKPCKYKLTAQLAKILKSRADTVPYQMNDGRSYAYFLTPAAAAA
ncbi:MAG: hypothetical protein GY833_22495 [Aestuariibacter sp.]|nr:hypothetical protein [Aestuariibacter sp.]|tara:strand:- start:255329 stop:255787 length:459 start_codon:yes stop_codon:yes gene_type:complete